MMTQTSIKKTTQEQQLLNIVRRLPGERVAQVIDFAQFIEAQQAKSRQELLELSEQVSEGDAKWDALLASDDAQRLLEQMADDALREISVGKAAPMRFTALLTCIERDETCQTPSRCLTGLFNHSA